MHSCWSSGHGGDDSVVGRVGRSLGPSWDWGGRPGTLKRDRKTELSVWWKVQLYNLNVPYWKCFLALGFLWKIGKLICIYTGTSVVGPKAKHKINLFIHIAQRSCHKIVCVWCMYVCVCVCVCVCVDQRSILAILFSPSTLCFWITVSRGSGIIDSAMLAGHRAPVTRLSAPVLQHWGYRHTLDSGFYVNAESLNSGSHAFKVVLHWLSHRSALCYITLFKKC